MPELTGALLEEEDACPAGEESEACALSLRQLRGERRSKDVSFHKAPHFQERLAEDVKVGITMGDDVDFGVQPVQGIKANDMPFSDPSLYQDSGAPLYTFYMYRAVSDEQYAPINVNAANLAGVLWYLHHEVVIQAPRKFNIRRIARFKVKMRATTPLLRLSMHFGVRMAFDRGQATGPFVCGRDGSKDPPLPLMCNGEFQESYTAKIATKNGPFEFEKYGYYVGCNELGYYPFPLYKTSYPSPVWYSLPGPCPSRTFDRSDDFCRHHDPGGFCGVGVTPTGNGSCTWTYEKAGEITVDELVGIGDYNQFAGSGKREYDPYTDKGIGFSWWDGINNDKANAERVRAARELFTKRFPNMTADADLQNPPCDFAFKRFYWDFHLRDPNSGLCEEPRGDSECAKAIDYALHDGFYAHPEWYVGLTAGSSRKEFQRVLFQQGMAGCKRPC